MKAHRVDVVQSETLGTRLFEARMINGFGKFIYTPTLINDPVELLDELLVLHSQ